MNPDHYCRQQGNGVGSRRGTYGDYVYDGPRYDCDDYYDEEEEGKVEYDPQPPVLAPPPGQQSALDDCMSQRNKQEQSECNTSSSCCDRKPGAFHDTAYDDMLERKRAEYAPPVPQTRSPATETLIELGPGVYARLRGASETWACIEVDFHVPVTCCACSLELCCIQDADYVLCPRCKVVSPLEVVAPPKNVDGGGVGLGFTFDELFKWQAEIMNRRNQSRRAALPVQA